MAKRVVKPHTVGLAYSAASKPISANQRAEDGAEIRAHGGHNSSVGRGIDTTYNNGVRNKARGKRVRD